MTDPIYEKADEELRAVLTGFIEHLCHTEDVALAPEDRKRIVESYIKKQPRSAVMVVINDEDKVLAVSRRNRPNDLGLPGGKIEKESAKQAAIRETLEETGVEVTRCKFVYERVDETDGRVAWCYLAQNWKGSAQIQEVGINVAWVDPKDLLESNCTFRDYNRGVLTKLGLI